MRSAQRLGWLSSSYGSTLATKLDGAQGKKHTSIGAEMCNKFGTLLDLEGCSVTKSGWTKVNCQGSEQKIGDDGGPTMFMVRVTRELDCFSAHIRLMERSKSEDKTEYDLRGVIDPLLLWRESISHKRGRGGGECRGKLQVLRQGRRAVAKELYKIGVDELLIKITKSEGLRVDAGVLDQGMK
ncbi:hypothetical protein B296_00004975 [Ensete ventricosum]|uniref:Uncharacterized protein n=1 Tax=Ensete ventricosum TaxID=4639 RepID=A0A426YUC3_ENSVE|nr:hypothetical protein B296_00004975 [Ensete ventricosum]